MQPYVFGLASAIDNLPWFAWVAIVAISGGCLSGIVTSLINHRERMAMIRMGMHPDQPQGDPHACAEKPYHPEGAEL